MNASRELYFEIHQEGVYVRTETFSLDVIKIGSHPKSHLFIEDEGVARVHAMVETGADGTVSIIDLGSGRGTWVAGEKVNKRRLDHRDVIRVGQTDLVFLTVDERRLAEEAAARAKAMELPKDRVVYARRFLARPSSTDGTVEVAVLFHDFVVQERLLSSPYRMTIGEDAKSDFPLVHPSVGAGPVPLVSGSVQAALLHVYPGMEGDLYVGTERYAASQASTIPGARSEGRTVVVPLTQDTRAKLSLGPLLFFVRCTRRPVVVIPSALFQDTGLPFLLASALLHLMVLGALAFSTAIPDVRRDAFRIDERLVQLLIQDLEPEPDPVEPETEVEDEEEEEAAGNEPAAGEAGRAGAEDIEPEPEPSRMAVEGTALSPEDVELARAEAREAVQDRGLLAVMNGPTNPFGSAMPNGMDAVTAIGAVQGNSTGASWGSGGLAAFGGGIGGGGRSMQGGFSGGSISLASRNSAVRQQAASTAVNLRENRRAAVPTLGIDGSAEIQGQLDREMIQRVVREHRREIRACYEAQLQRNPELEGRVQINWIISPDGAVAAARVSTTTLNSRDVEECMVRRIRQWRFPEPRGGGTVNVNFPFDFAPGG